MEEEKFVCDECNKIVYGNNEVYMLNNNSIYCQPCYHELEIKLEKECNK